MERLSESRKQLLANAVSTFHAALPGSPAEDLLRARGLHDDGPITEQVKKLRLGYVQDPLPGFEKYVGRLAIPYLRRHPRHGWFCISMRFRRIGDDEYTPKYEGMSGDRTRLYNAQALNAPSPVVGLCEGELDAVTGTVAGIPTVGVPGAQNWKPHYTPLFKGYDKVYVFVDGDEPGQKFADHVSQVIPQAIQISCGAGEDLNSLFQRGGADAIHERLPK